MTGTTACSSGKGPARVSESPVDEGGRGEASRGWEEALESSGARLSAIIDSAMDAVLSVDEDQQIVVFNRAAELMFRLSRAEALGEPLERFVPARFREAHRDKVRRFAEGAGASRILGRTGNLKALRADGDEFPIEASISKVSAAGHQVLTVVVRDVTERVRMESRLRLLAETGAVVASTLDFGETLTRVAALVVPALADRCALHVLDEDGAVRLSAGDPAEAGDGVQEVLRTGSSSFRPDHMIVPLPMRETVRGALSLFAGPERRFDAHDLALAGEIGRRAGMALENARLYRELQEADRRKDQFLAMLAHELRNPLSAISNALQVLRHSAPGDARAGRAQDIIERQVHHQVRLVDDLLDVTRIARNRMKLHPEPLDLSGLVRCTAEDHRREIERAGHRLVLELPPGPVPLEADSTRLAQVLGNLLHNARKFTDPGGVITVRVEVRLDRGEVGVHVADTGLGIPPDLLPILFDAFAQAEQSLERSRGGLGLGLALVKGLVELHGGRVEVSSRPREGSTFSFWLPGPPAVLEAQPEGPQAPGAAARRILVVEDNSGVAESLRDLLDVMGHQVAVARDGVEGLAVAAEFRPDIVLCDLGLPGLDGYEVARRLRAEPAMRDSLLVALTGYGQEADRRRSAEAGFDLHLTKPLRLPELEELLQRAGRPDR